MSSGLPVFTEKLREAVIFILHELECKCLGDGGACERCELILSLEAEGRYLDAIKEELGIDE